MVKTAQDTMGLAERREADRLLLRVGRQGGFWLAAFAVTALALAGAETLLPAALGRAVDAAFGGASRSWVLWSGLLVAVLVAFDALDDLAVGATIARSTSWLRHRLLRHILALGTRATERFPPGDVASRLVGNAAAAGRIGPDAVRAVVNLVPAVGGIVALALIDPWLCLTFLAGFPLFVFLVRAFARDVSKLVAQYLEIQGRIAARLVDALGGARSIAAAGTIDREAERILEPLPELHRSGLGVWHAQMRITAQDAILVSLLEIAVLAVAGAELANHRISPGQMFAASQYVLLAMRLASVVSFVSLLARARAAAGRTAEVMSQPPVPYGTERLPAGRGRIEFRGVTVRAGAEPILDAIDLEVPAGKLVAVVGRSGAGKSLLAALAGRLVDPDEGEVLLDGVPLPLVDRSELRREVGYGFERPVLLGDTLEDAIAFGGYAPSPEDLVAASKAAQADGFIRRMPEGYQTRPSEAPMSGGEIQRVGLARTFAHAGRVLILDDVAASLDTVTEHQIGLVLAEALADRTRIVVAHRASTASRADLVVWLDGRGIRAVAPHATLWRQRDYRSLFSPDEGPSERRRRTGPTRGTR